MSVALAFFFVLMVSYGDGVNEKDLYGVWLDSKWSEEGDEYYLVFNKDGFFDYYDFDDKFGEKNEFDYLFEYCTGTWSIKNDGEERYILLSCIEDVPESHKYWSLYWPLYDEPKLYEIVKTKDNTYDIGDGEFVLKRVNKIERDYK